MKKTLISIMALVMLLSMILVPAAADDGCAMEITVEFVDCNPETEVVLIFKEQQWLVDAGFPGQTLTFSADNAVQDMPVPKKDIQWMFGDENQATYWDVVAPEGYTVTSEFLDGDGNDPATKGHAKFIVTGLGADKPIVNPQQPKPETPDKDNAKTGDITVSVLAGLMALSVVGAAVVIGKKH